MLLPRVVKYMHANSAWGHLTNHDAGLHRCACRHTTPPAQDAEYEKAGAQLSEGKALQQDIVLKVRPPHPEKEVPQLRAGAR